MMKKINIITLFAFILLVGGIQDLNAQNVGIGTATPSEKLHVVGGTRITGLSGIGNRMVVSDANGVLGTQAIPGGLTGVTAGAGLTGGGLVGNPTIDVVALNGLTTNANDIRLGGALVQNTEITLGTFSMTYNLDNVADFHIQDNGTNKFTVLDNGNSAFGGDVFWRDVNSTTGTILAQLTDDGNDGRFRIMENGNTSVDLDANTQFVFNEQGLNRDFRVESDNNQNMFRVDANVNRVGIGTNLPTETIHVEGGARVTSLTGAGNRMVISDANGVLGTQAIPTGAPTVNNGLNIAGSGDIHLGGTLIENTTIVQGGFMTNFNLDGTGDFNVQDNGIDKFTVLDNGNSAFGGDVTWRDVNSITGTILAQLTDDANDGRFRIMENGLTSVDLDANTQFAFNEQGLDRNFRVESNNVANMLFVDAGNDRIGVGTGAPTEALHVTGGTRITTGAVIGQHPTYGTHLLTLASANSPALQLGSMAYNQLEAGRLTFEERVPDYAAAGTAYCGFQIHQDGAANTLNFSSSCPLETVYMTLERGGELGIGTNLPTAVLSVNGDANKTGGGTWTVFSDKRLKKDISDYTEGLDFITKVRTVNFKYNDKMSEIWGENAKTKDRTYQGVIAQELQEIAPDMVRAVNLQEALNPEDADYDASLHKESETFLEVDPNKFTYALINAVKEQQVIISELKAEQANTKKELTALKKMLTKGAEK